MDINAWMKSDDFDILNKSEWMKFTQWMNKSERIN